MNEREQKYYEQGLLEGPEYSGAGSEADNVRVLGVANLLNVSYQEAERRLVEDYNQRLDALPSLTKFPELAGMRECVQAHTRGAALTAGIREEDIIIVKNYLPFLTREMSWNDKTPDTNLPTAAAEPGCTLVYFPHSDTGPLLGNNSDDPYRPGASRREPVWQAGNKAGLMLGTVSSGVLGDEISPEIFPAPVFSMVYELCITTGEALEMLTRYNQFWGPCNLLIADSNGDSAVIEKSTCRYGVRKSEDGFSATTAMAAEEGAFKEYLWQSRERSLNERGLGTDSVDQAYWKAAESRSSRLLAMLDAARPNPTRASLENILYDHTGDPDQICLAGEKCHPDEEVVNWTLRSVVHVLDERYLCYSFAEPPRGAHLTTRYRKDFAPIDFVF